MSEDAEEQELYEGSISREKASENASISSVAKEKEKETQNPVMVLNTFKCEKCTFETTYLNRLNQHQKIHKEKKLFECPHCEFTSSRRGYLERHLEAHERGTARKHERNPEVIQRRKAQKLYRCSQCEYVTNSSGALGIHSVVHKPEKPYQCKYCLHKTKWKHELRNHEKIHEKSRAS